MSVHKTGTRCSVKFCNNRASARKMSFFSYPKENDRRLVWMQNCDTFHLADALAKKNSYKVCAEHFVSKMFLNPNARNRLVFNAVPTLFSGKHTFGIQRLNFYFYLFTCELYPVGAKISN